MALALTWVAIGVQARTSIIALDAALPARPGTVLPVYVPPAAPLTGDAAVVIERVDFVGNTILGDELAAVAARYSGRRLTPAELRELQDALTLVYVQRGYVTSGARLDSIRDAVLQVEIVEGRLEQIRVQSDHYRPTYLAGYLESFGTLEPLNAYDIERRLQALSNEPRVEGVDAQLLPTEQRGDAVLAVTTTESPPLSVGLEANNYQLVVEDDQSFIGQICQRLERPTAAAWATVQRNERCYLTVPGDSAPDVTALDGKFSVRFIRDGHVARPQISPHDDSRRSSPQLRAINSTIDMPMPPAVAGWETRARSGASRAVRRLQSDELAGGDDLLSAELFVSCVVEVAIGIAEFFITVAALRLLLVNRASDAGGD